MVCKRCGIGEMKCRRQRRCTVQRQWMRRRVWRASFASGGGARTAFKWVVRSNRVCELRWKPPSVGDAVFSHGVSWVCTRIRCEQSFVLCRLKAKEASWFIPFFLLNDRYHIRRRKIRMWKYRSKRKETFLFLKIPTFHIFTKQHNWTTPCLMIIRMTSSWEVPASLIGEGNRLRLVLVELHHRRLHKHKLMP